MSGALGIKPRIDKLKALPLKYPQVHLCLCLCIDYFFQHVERVVPANKEQY